MTDAQQREAARQFFYRWNGKGREDEDARSCRIEILSNSSIYHFGVLTSNVHMAWMRAIYGRLKSDFSYSNTIVYNNFPWPDPTSEQKAQIETQRKDTGHAV